MRRALIIGNDNYINCDTLKGCINDATNIAARLMRNGDGSPNFEVKQMNDSTTRDIKKNVEELFQGDSVDTCLLYFSGHGCCNNIDGYVLGIDAEEYAEGMSMTEILKLANKSKIKNKIIVLDCCYSGKMGNPTYSNDECAISDGITILTACGKKEYATEQNGMGVFTSLLIDALDGGASDILGNITPGSIYSYIDKALGAWGQRPMFKTNVSSFVEIRRISPLIALELLRNITEYFEEYTDELKLDPSFEDTTENFSLENSKKFKILQKYCGLGLVKPVGEEHMYYAAMNSKSCKLTALGYQYWRLVKEGRI